MRWIEVTIESTGSSPDELCARLEELGAADGLVIEDESDFNRFLEDNRDYWDYVDEELSGYYKGLSRVKFYLTDDEDGASVLGNVRRELGDAVAVSYVEDSDWENNWREYYKPMEIGEKLLIVPEWETADAAGRVILRLDPGLMFGTGSHPTTRLCLSALEEYTPRGGSALDLGCGSGILGIAALLLGCGRVASCDIDPKAPDAVTRNAALNNFQSGESIKVMCGDITTDGGLRRRLGTGYDIIMANIVADVIISLAGFVRDFAAPDAVMIFSGIIDGREDEVKAALESAGVRIVGHTREDGWHCFIGR